MLVKGIVPRGYCKGVVRAIEIAKKQAHQETPVYILGMIVHNQYIVNALEDLGIQTIDRKGKTRLELLDEIDHGKVIITAHGASQKVFDKAKAKGLEVIDASCLDVIKTHDLIQCKLNEGYEILYIGKKGHPEAEGAISIDEDKIHFECVETEKERGVDIFMKKNGVSAPIPYADDCTDRDTTLRSIQEYLSPQYQLRWYMGSLGSDPCFLYLSHFRMGADRAGIWHRKSFLLLCTGAGKQCHVRNGYE